MSKIKFTREDMQTTFMEVDVETSNLMLWRRYGDDCMLSAKITATLNGNVILVATYQYYRGLADSYLNEYYEDHSYAGGGVSLQHYDFDPEVRKVVWDLIYSHDNAKFLRLIKQDAKRVGVRNRYA